jgi:hypothetical protein
MAGNIYELGLVFSVWCLVFGVWLIGPMIRQTQKTKHQTPTGENL